MVPTDYADDFKRGFSAGIVGKYPNAFPASTGLSRYGDYQGPAIKTIIRATGVQSCEVTDDDGAILAAFTLPVGRTAFDAAVAVAECRGLPWRVSGCSEVFDPANAQRWSYKCFPH